MTNKNPAITFAITSSETLLDRYYVANSNEAVIVFNKVNSANHLFAFLQDLLPRRHDILFCRIYRLRKARKRFSLVNILNQSCFRSFRAARSR